MLDTLKRQKRGDYTYFFGINKEKIEPEYYKKMWLEVHGNFNYKNFWVKLNYLKLINKKKYKEYFNFLLKSFSIMQDQEKLKKLSKYSTKSKFAFEAIEWAIECNNPKQIEIYFKDFNKNDIRSCFHLMTRGIDLRSLNAFKHLVKLSDDILKTNEELTMGVADYLLFLNEERHIPFMKALLVYPVMVNRVKEKNESLYNRLYPYLLQNKINNFN